MEPCGICASNTRGPRSRRSYSPAGDTAIIALHGAATGTKDSFLYKHLHDVLPQAGIGVVTFDRRGEGASTGDSSRGRLDMQVGDALAVLEAVDAERVGLWGFSQGGWVAPLAAVASDRVAFLVLLASTGVTPSERMMYATAEQLRRGGYDAAIVRRALALRRAFEDWVHGRERERESGLKAELSSGLEDVVAARVPAAESARRRGTAALDRGDGLRSKPVLEQVRVPTLLVYGEDDAWTPVGPSVEAWRQAGRDDVEIVLVPEATHELTLPDGTLASKYERTLVDWLVRRSRS